MRDLAREIRKKENKTDLEWEFLKCTSVLNIIEEILIDVSKWHYNPEDGINKIREILKDNLD